MSVVQRGLRSSTRSKTITARLRGLAGAEGPGPTPLLPPRPAAAPRSAPVRPEGSIPLAPDLHAAAERLAEIFAAAAFETWTRGGPDGLPPTDPLEPSPDALLARHAYRAAMRAVPLALSPLIVHVCCLGLPLGQWAAERQIPRAAAERALRQGLTHLLNHFRAPG